jgi:iron complex outermembrane recepter protein
MLKLDHRGFPTLSVAAAISLVLSGAALAQQTQTAAESGEQDSNVSELDEVVVTGSRIRRESLSEAPVPTVTVGSEQIAERQYTNVIDAVSELQIGTVQTSRGANTQFGSNFAFVDLLNVGTQRTLTLLNGRRVVPSNQGTVFVPGNASGAQVDLSLINPLILERVEVVSGTGGAVYGADALAGVVNIITKQDFEGFNVDVSGGIVEDGRDMNSRVSAIFGKNLFNDRLNFTVTGEYYNSDLVRTNDKSPGRYQGAPITNSLNSATRDPNAFSGTQAVADLIAGRTLNPVFVPTNSDGVPSTVFGPQSLRDPQISTGGVLAAGQFLGGATATTPFYPSTTVGVAAGFGAAADPQGLAFFAPSALTAAQAANPTAVIAALSPGLDVTALSAAQRSTLALQLLQRNRPTPYEYALRNPQVNPLLYVASFGGTGAYPTINNTDPATAALFPRVAVPLQFDPSGNLVPFDVGTIAPPNQARVGAAFNGTGYDSFAARHQQTRAGTERAAFMAQHKFDITDNIRWTGEYLYTDITFKSIGAAQANSPRGSTTAGTRSIPIYVDQNPFLNAQARATINGLGTQGLTIPVIGGQRALYMGRALADLTGGGSESANEVKTWRVAQVLEGDFQLAGRDVSWSLSGALGEAESVNRAEQLLDIEFALAADVVQGPNGPVCRQQTLAAPESIAVRNPQLATINTALSLVPTAAQVAACRPLNLFGDGAPSPEAIAYVTADGGTTNTNEQEYFAASIGADLFELPAGALALNLQGEYRSESIAFVPGEVAAAGAARNTRTLPNTGELEFTEYGAELRLPIFGGEASYPVLRGLEIEGAFRRVKREQETESTFFANSGPATEDDVYSIGLRWKPLEQLTLRGNVSTSVRSASLVELFSAPSSGFSNPAGGANPCRNSAITQGPNPDIRRRNCIAAVRALGIAADDAAAAAFLSTFTGTAGARPAAATGNPFLQNEKGDAYSIGLTWAPDYAPGLQVGIDYINLEITEEVGLYSPADYIQNCFDSASFPGSVVSGTPVCDLFTFGVQQGGQFVIPSVNPITGNPVTGGAPTGSPAQVQAGFETAFFQFPNFNLGKRELQAVNFEARYNFDLENLLGDRAENWGNLGLRASVFYTKKLDLFADGITLSDQRAGQDPLTASGVPKYQTRFDVRHKIGAFTHTLQWFWRDETVDNVLTPTDQFPEQSVAFVNRAYHYFNYNSEYDVNDDLSVKFTINNLTNTDGPNGIYGDAYDLGIGREYVLGVSMKF